jgi:hypothetical protein
VNEIWGSCGKAMLKMSLTRFLAPRCTKVQYWGINFTVLQVEDFVFESHFESYFIKFHETPHIVTQHSNYNGASWCLFQNIIQISVPKLFYFYKDTMVYSPAFYNSSSFTIRALQNGHYGSSSQLSESYLSTALLLPYLR